MRANLVKYLFVAILSGFCIFPFYMMFVMGTFRSEDLFRRIPLIPSDYLLENLQTVFGSKMLLYYWNSFYVAVVSTILSVFISAMTGFAFAKYQFRFKNFLFILVLSTMMIPSQLGLIAYVIEMRAFHLNNTHLPLILIMTHNAFAAYFMKEFIQASVPNEVLESARIDGCNEWSIFIKMVFPFILPAVSTIGMLVFLASWNDFLLPTVIINKQSLLTLPLGITTLDSLFRTDYAAKILGLAMGTLPLIVLFLLGSKTFVKGLTGAAVKG